jgi:hypothetical protein
LRAAPISTLSASSWRSVNLANADAGSEHIARGIWKWRERAFAENMHFFKSRPTPPSG